MRKTKQQLEKENKELKTELLKTQIESCEEMIELSNKITLLESRLSNEIRHGNSNNIIKEDYVEAFKHFRKMQERSHERVNEIIKLSSTLFPYIMDIVSDKKSKK